MREKMQAMGRTQKILFIAALFGTNVIMMADFVVLPITDVFYSLFLESTALVNFMISGPSLVIMVAALLVPAALKHVSKRTLTIIACAVFACASAGGALFVSLPYMIACRVLVGLSYAICQVCAIGIISDMWVDEGQRARFTGFYNGAQAAIGSAMGFAAGWLASGGWQNAYLVYLVAIPMTIMVILFMPSGKSADTNAAGNATSCEDEGGHEGEHDAKRVLGWRFWMLMLGFCIVCISFGIVFMYFTSLYVAENGLGDSSFSGTLSSLTTLGSMCMCFSFGKVFGKLGKLTPVVFVAVLGFAILGMYLVPGTATAPAICLIAGGCYGTLLSYAYAYASISVPRNLSDKAIGIITSAYGLAMFSCTYLETWASDAFAMGMTTPTFVLLAIACIALAVVGAADYAAARILAVPKAQVPGARTAGTPGTGTLADGSLGYEAGLSISFLRQFGRTSANMMTLKRVASIIGAPAI